MIETKVIEFEDTPLPEYKGLYAVILDNVLSQEECKEFIKMAECSAGAHDGVNDIYKNGWRPASTYSTFNQIRISVYVLHTTNFNSGECGSRTGVPVAGLSE